MMITDVFWAIAVILFYYYEFLGLGVEETVGGEESMILRGSAGEEKNILNKQALRLKQVAVAGSNCKFLRS